ncbi:MAG: hypothetical protein JW982_11765 [Spirochaetes bacterium]|nr:hypothetical protein [Spirochaetota bacterium]
MFGEFLILKGVIDKVTLQNALELQKKIGKMLGETLVESGMIPQELLDQYLNEHLLFRTQEIINEFDDDNNRI